MSEEKKSEFVVPKKFEDIVSKIEEMPVLELNELVKVFEEKFGVSAVAVAAAPTDGAEDKVQEKTEFNIELISYGETKIEVIKVVKASLGLGLKEAKDLVDAAPSVLKENSKKEDAEKIKAEIEAVGGKVELK